MHAVISEVKRLLSTRSDPSPILMFKNQEVNNLCERLRRALADGTGCLAVCSWINIHRCGKL
jgi:hypothetical protein